MDQDVVAPVKVSFTDALINGLLAETETQNADCIPVVVALRDAVGRHRLAEGFDAGLVASAEVALAFEALMKAAKAGYEAVRATLSATVHDSGCPGFYTAHHHVSTRSAPVVVRVVDQKALEARHPGLMIQPPQPPVPPMQPDLDTIKKRLTAGDEVAGCVLSNGGPGGLVFSKLKGKA